MNIDFAQISNLGNREQNEDAIKSWVQNDTGFFALADGLGGHEKGEVASNLVVEESIGAMQNFQSEKLYRLIDKAFNISQDKLLNKIEQEKMHHGMKTTLVLLAIVDKRACWGHIGDSRLYMFRNNNVAFQTMDHSVPQALFVSGEIKQKDVRNHPDRNKLLKTMGSGQNGINWDVYKEEVNLISGDTFLLASDGFWELIDEKKMLKTLKSSSKSQMWLDAMERIVVKNGRNKNMDNYSAIAIRIK